MTFSGVLWSISPLLFGVAVLYAAAGSYFTIVLGRPLITLNYDRLDREASFRSGLIHLRENAEPVFLTRGEARQKARLVHRIDDLVANLRRIIAVKRNLGFFTGGYNWMIQIVPDLIIAPAFIRGDIEFGVVTQSGAAFAMLVGAFSLVVRQFNSISNFAAVVSRLTSLQEAIEGAHTLGSAIEIVEREGPLTFERLSLVTPGDDSPAAQGPFGVDPDWNQRPGHRPSHAPGAALFRATAGIPTSGNGRIVRLDGILFLPQRPYLSSGTLRQVLVRPEKESEIPDDRILSALSELGLERVIEQFGGLDAEAEWEKVLSLAEQQLVAVASVILSAPRFVLLDWLERTLDTEQFRKALQLLAAHSITALNFGKADEVRDLHQAILEYGENGSWTWTLNARSALRR